MAPAIAAAAVRNATFVLPAGDKSCEWIGWLKDLFLSINTTVPLLPYSMLKSWANVGEPGFTEYKSLPPNSKNFTIAGYRQSWKYFEKEVEQKALRKTFQFNSKYEASAEKTINNAKSKFKISDPILVGMHMRIGDLKDKNRLDYGYVMANRAFYKKAMSAAKKLFNSSKAIIFITASDTPNEAKAMLSPLVNNYNIAWSHGTAFEDFATLSKCNHSIISGGTYGFWTAWLAGGKTFYFNGFAKKGTKFYNGFKSENFYLPTWIPV